MGAISGNSFVREFIEKSFYSRSQYIIGIIQVDGFFTSLSVYGVRTEGSGFFIVSIETEAIRVFRIPVIVIREESLKLSEVPMVDKGNDDEVRLIASSQFGQIRFRNVGRRKNFIGVYNIQPRNPKGIPDTFI